MQKNMVVKSNKLITAIQNLSLFEARIIQLAIVDARESGKGLHVDTPLRIDAFRYAEVFGTTRQNAYIKLKETEETLFNRRKAGRDSLQALRSRLLKRNSPKDVTPKPKKAEPKPKTVKQEEQLDWMTSDILDRFISISQANNRRYLTK
jgi:hypothetical protein